MAYYNMEYYIYICINGIYTNEQDLILQNILMIPFSEQAGHLWFMYTLLGIYLIAPIISGWLSVCERKDLEIILFIWSFTLWLPYLEVWNSQVKEIVKLGGALYYFYGFAGHALLGYYLFKYVEIPIFGRQYISLLGITLIFHCILFMLFPKSVFAPQLSVSAVLLSSCVFLFFKGLHYKQNKIVLAIQSIAKYSFGIYLSHMLFMEPLTRWLTHFHIHYVIQIPITVLIVGLISYLFVRLFSFIPKSYLLFG